MIRIIFPVFFVCILSIGCSSQTIHNRNIALIHRAIKAIETSDTSELYGLFDTAFCFKIYGKEAFLYKVNLISNRLKICGSKIADSNIIVHRIDNIAETQYIIRLCIEADSSKALNVIMSFEDEQKGDIILLLDATLPHPVIERVRPPGKG